MSYPKHPNQIIIRNKFYPNGLTELDIYNCYQKYKTSILEQVKNRNVILFIKTKDNIVVKRKGKTSNFIQLTNQNYDDLTTGRVLSIHGVMNRHENIAIVDIDTKDFNKAKEAVIDCYNVLNKIPIFLNKQIRYTGKTSFHIICELSKKMGTDSIKLLLEKVFTNSIISKKYSIKKSIDSKVNIDLYRNVYNAGFILLNSLSIIGLKCIEVSYNDMNYFNREDSRIK